MRRNHIVPVKSLIVLVALSLAGCAGTADDLALDSGVAYGGSARHPIKVSGHHAYVEDCNDWTENAISDTSNTFLDSHGCAVQSNIASMIVDPKGLKRKPKKRKGYYAATVVTAGASPGAAPAAGAGAGAGGSSGGAGSSAPTN